MNYERYKEKLAEHRASLSYTYHSAESLMMEPPTPEALDTQQFVFEDEDKLPHGRPPAGMVFSPKFGGFYVPKDSADSLIITAKDLVEALSQD